MDSHRHSNEDAWRGWVAQGLRAAPVLTVFGFLMLANLVGTMVGLVIDHGEISGAPAWLKPAKFALSTMIAAWSFAACIATTDVWLWVTRSIDWVIALNLGVEIVLIDMQAARGTASHFNVATRFDSNVFATMALSIALIWLSMLVLTIVLFRQPFVDAASGWSLRLGLVLALVGAGSGALMTVPTPQQLAKAHATGEMKVTGAHTVGAADGGRGLPVTGWSTDHGDLRVAHFVGMHGLQVLPLLAWWNGRRARARGQRPRRRFVFASFATYLALFGLILWQAFRGQSIAAPDRLSLISFTVWLLVSGVLLVWMDHDRAGGAMLERTV